MVVCFRSGEVASLNMVKLTPSNRANPLLVANQRYPSAVCCMERTESWGNPFEVVQTSWPNWVSVSLGSNPQAGPDSRAKTNKWAGRNTTIHIGRAGQTL